MMVSDQNTDISKCSFEEESLPAIASFEQVKELFKLPFFELLHKAHSVHKVFFPEQEMQISTLINIKTGSCPENCSYCPQSAHYSTGLQKEPLMDVDAVKSLARNAKERGATRLCLGAAWRGPTDKDLKVVCEMVKALKEEGLESCVTLGLLKAHQAKELKEAGLDFYNHNIDTSKEFYAKIITTRTFDDRLETINYVRAAGIKVCCGGIIGMGETNEDRLNMLWTLANFDPQPESVPINKLIPIPGTPLEEATPTDPFDFVRIVAIARLLMPKTFVRLTAGRYSMSDELQALCFYAGVNSIHYGEKLLVTKNPEQDKDDSLLSRLGIHKKSINHQ